MVKTGFFEYLNFALQFAPPGPEEEAIRAKLAKIGVGAGKTFDFKDLSLKHKVEVDLGMKDGEAKVAKFLSADLRRINGWNVGSLFGDRAFFNGDWLERAAAAKGGIYGNDAIEAMYPLTKTLADGDAHRYFFTVPEEDIPLHFELMRALDDRALVCRTRHFPDLEFSEFIVVTRDQPGLFSMIAGALTANNLNILSARITTRTNGIAMDVFRVSHQMGEGSMALEEDRWLRVEHDLERVITGQQDIAALVESAHHVQNAGRKFVRHVSTEVTVDNRTSEQFTVIDVFTQDRVGLLFAITHTLFRSDRAGKKLEDLDRMRELRAALLEKVEQT